MKNFIYLQKLALFAGAACRSCPRSGFRQKAAVRLAALCRVAATVVMLAATGARAVDFHVGTAQDLQNALTLAAANGADDVIYLTNGYYLGNFNYNSAEARNLTLLAETNLSNTQITLDGAGGGRALNLSSSASTGNITVQGITFLRNCGSTSLGAVRIGAGSSAAIGVTGCQFLSLTNSSGMGLEIISAQNVTVSQCTAVGNKNSRAFAITSVSGLVNILGCQVTDNSVSGQNGGGIYVSGIGILNVSACLISRNSAYFSGPYIGGAGGGIFCGGANSVTMSNNIFLTNATSLSSGGGLSCSASSIALANNLFSGNYGSDPSSSIQGGGAYCSGGTVSLTGNRFIGNYTPYNGSGGGASCSGTVTLSGNTFNGNSAQSGGGGYFSGTVNITENSFSGNSSFGGGGGGVQCSGSVTISNNVFTGNSGASQGGGINYTGSGSVAILTKNIIKQNIATQFGGGIYASGANVTILDNLIAKNIQSSSSTTGGGIWVNASSNLLLINNTITGNTSAGGGGGAAFQVSGVVEVLNVFNNIIWGNSANGSGADVFLTGSGQKKVFSFNDVDSISGVWDIAVSNLDVSPQFFDPVNGDYHIQGTSPCKDAGTNGAPSLPATDLDGGPRIANGTVDLGCYEFSTAAAHPADTDTNFVLTAAEFNAYAAAWKSGQSWSNAPTVIPADYVTRAGYLMTNGGTYHNDGSARPVNWKTGP